MADAYWLNPLTDEAYPVSRHEIWISDPQNQEKIGLPEKHRKLIGLLDQHDVDGIRLAAVRGGLIRTRRYQNRVSVQMSVSGYQLKDTLWSVYQLLQRTLSDKHADIDLHNLYNNDSTRVSLSSFGDMLRDDKTILRETKEEPQDIKPDSKLMKRLDDLLEKL